MPGRWVLERSFGKVCGVPCPPAPCCVSLPLDVSPGAQVVVDNDFSMAFKRPERRPWNFTAFLMLPWLCGVAVRYAVLMPLRVVVMVLSILSCMAQFWLWNKLFAKADAAIKKQRIENHLRGFGDTRTPLY